MYIRNHLYEHRVGVFLMGDGSPKTEDGSLKTEER